MLGVAFFGAVNVFGLSCIVDSVTSRLSLRTVLLIAFHRWDIILHVFLLVWGNFLQCYGVIFGFLS
jgi:hypothetical protein